MSLMYRSNSYIVHHCWFSEQGPWNICIFSISATSPPQHPWPIYALPLRLHCHRSVFIATKRFILNDKRLSYSQWFHPIFYLHLLPREIHSWKRFVISSTPLRPPLLTCSHRQPAAVNNVIAKLISTFWRPLCFGSNLSIILFWLV